MLLNTKYIVSSMVLLSVFALVLVFLVYGALNPTYDQNIENAIHLKKFEVFLADNWMLLDDINNSPDVVKSETGLIITENNDCAEYYLATMIVFPKKDKVIIKYRYFNNKYMIEKGKVIPLYHDYQIPTGSLIYRLCLAESEKGARAG